MSQIDKEFMDKVLENIKEGATGIPTGFERLDKSLGGGLQNGYLYVLGARPAMGKTAFALNIVCNAIKNGINVTYYCLEMNKERLVERLLYMMANIPLPRESYSLTEEDWSKLINAAEKIGRSKLIIDDTPGISIEEISWENMGQPSYQESQLIIIDYLQLISAHMSREGYEFKSRQQEMDFVCKELKRMARDNNVPVLVLSQLSRACETRSEHRPILSDFKDFSAIETMADVVLFLYRDEYYNFDSEIKGIAEITVAKNKSGYCSFSEYGYLPECTKFVNLRRGNE